MYKTGVYIKWNDACEGNNMEEVHMLQCIQEVMGFLVDKDIEGNYYVARDYNTINGEGVECFEKVIRIPEKYIIEKRFFEL
jgi:hypothetical protein